MGFMDEYTPEELESFTHEELELLKEADYVFSPEKKNLRKLIGWLNECAKRLCGLYNVSCCTRQNDKHLYFQCKCSDNSIIASYHKDNNCFDIRLRDQFIAFMGAHEVDSIINKKYKTCEVARDLKETSSMLLEQFQETFSDNAYVIKYKEITLAAMKRTNILQEEDDDNISLEEEVCEEEDKDLSLGMPMQPQEDDEQLENEERKLPPSPPMDEG